MPHTIAKSLHSTTAVARAAASAADDAVEHAVDAGRSIRDNAHREPARRAQQRGVLESRAAGTLAIALVVGATAFVGWRLVAGRIRACARTG